MSDALEIIRAAKAISEASSASGLLAGAARIEALIKAPGQVLDAAEQKPVDTPSREALLEETVKALSDQVQSLITMQKSVVDALTALASRPVEVKITQEPITVKIDMPANVTNITNVLPESPIEVTAIMPARKRVSSMTYDNLDRVKELVQIDSEIIKGGE